MRCGKIAVEKKDAGRTNGLHTTNSRRRNTREISRRELSILEAAHGARRNTWRVVMIVVAMVVMMMITVVVVVIVEVNSKSQ